MPDSFSELRGVGGSSRAWVVGGIAVLAIAVLAAVAAGAYALSRPAAERNPLPQVVTVTAQPAPLNDAPRAASPAPGTYSGWLTSSSPRGESGWNGVLTFGGDSAMLSYPARNCTLLLTRGGEDGWAARALTRRCPAHEGTWELHEVEPGVIEIALDGAGGESVRGALSWEPAETAG